MNPTSESEVLDSLVRLYPLCKRVFLHAPWQTGDFTSTQRLILLTCAVSGRLTMTHLSDSIACPKEQTSRAASPLVQNGYLTRIYDKENRTRVFVELTPEGRQLIRRQYQVFTQEFHRLLSALSPEDQDRLAQSLKAICQILEHSPLLG